MHTSLWAFPKRLLRHLLVERSYERYYSAAGWHQSYTEGYVLNSNSQDARYGALLVLMQRYDHGHTILDLGCGEGLLAEKYRRLSATSILGIDYAQAAIELAKAKALPNCQFVCADYRKYAVQGPIGLIVLNESLYYLEDAVETMEQLSRHLSTDGVFLVSMFRTLVTRRLWKALRPRYRTVQSVFVHDETHGRSWHIRVLQPHASGGVARGPANAGPLSPLTP